jgi:hypothetical protein
VERVTTENISDQHVMIYIFTYTWEVESVGCREKCHKNFNGKSVIFFMAKVQSSGFSCKEKNIPDVR